jgi:hypothetical protein
MPTKTEEIRSQALEAAMRAEPLIWIRENKIVNEKGKLIRVDGDSPHFFLEALYLDRAQKIAVRKPSQVGVSLWAIVAKGIHGVRMWGINVIHTLPTVSDVGKFVPAKINELIKKNPAIKKGISDKEVDAIAQKQFGKGFYYIKGTKSEREALMITSDRNIYDELDKSDMVQVGNYASRQEGAESLKEEVWLSTPTIPNFGIDEKYSESDQKHWRFNCGKCGYEQHMVWPDNVDLKREVYICSSCGTELKPAWIRPRTRKNPEGTGKWKARFPGREISGYWITQMIVPWITCAGLIKEYKHREKKGQLDYFYNHKLGLPYVSAESQIPASLIYRNLTQVQHTEVNCLMGVDVQLRELYVTIGTEEGVFGILIVRDEYDEFGEIIKSKWDRLAELMEVYDVRIAVIDGGFMINDVIAFAKRFPHRVYVNLYKDDPKKAKVIRFADEDFQDKKEKTFEEEIIVLTERDRMIDWLLSDLQKGFIRFFYHQNDEAIKLLVAHTSTTYARTVTDRKGQESREWISTGKDDALHSLIYFRIALEKRAAVRD